MVNNPLSKARHCLRFREGESGVILYLGCSLKLLQKRDFRVSTWLKISHTLLDFVNDVAKGRGCSLLLLNIFSKDF